VSVCKRYNVNQTNPKLILHQVVGNAVQFIYYTTAMTIRQVFQTSLQDTTTIRMRGKLTRSVAKGPKERKTLWWHCHDKFLDHLWEGYLDWLNHQDRSDLHDYHLCLWPLPVNEVLSCEQAGFVAPPYRTQLPGVKYESAGATKENGTRHFLNNPTTINIEWQVDNCILNNQHQTSSLVLCAKIHQFLNDLQVVSKRF